MGFKIKDLKKSVKNTLSTAGQNAFDSARSRIKNALNIDGLVNTDEFLQSSAVREFPFGIYSDGVAIGFTAIRTTPAGFFEPSSQREITTIYLPVPPAFVRSTQASYGAQELGPISQSLGNQLGNFLGGGDVDLQEVQSAVGSQVKKNLIQAGASLTGINVFGQLQKTSGVALNPNESVLFEKISFRTYQFTYKFMPRNKKESEMLHNIIKVFEITMLPDVSAEGAGFLTVPDHYKLSFTPDIESFMPSFLPCVLTDMSVTYNENKSIFHEDGSPNEVSLSLTFQETELLTRSEASRKYGVNTSQFTPQ